MFQQDSTDPTGVAVVVETRSNGVATGVTRARNRKANAAIQMRLAGARYDEVAAVLGYPTARTAQVAVERALEKELRETDRDALRRLAGARLERLLRGVWSKAINPEDPEQLAAAGRAREFVADYRKLMGLDAPTEIVVHNPTTQELEAWVARVVSVGLPAVEEYDILEGEVVDDPVPA